MSFEYHFWCSITRWLDVFILVHIPILGQARVCQDRVSQDGVGFEGATRLLYDPVGQYLAWTWFRFLAADVFFEIEKKRKGNLCAWECLQAERWNRFGFAMGGWRMLR